MVQSASGETDNCPAVMKLATFYRILQVHYNIHRIVSLNIILSEMNPIITITSDFFKIQFNIIFLTIPNFRKRYLPFIFSEYHK
jgi:hypothetical protein